MSGESICHSPVRGNQAGVSGEQQRRERVDEAKRACGIKERRSWRKRRTSRTSRTRRSGEKEEVDMCRREDSEKDEVGGTSVADYLIGGQEPSLKQARSTSNEGCLI